MIEFNVEKALAGAKVSLRMGVTPINWNFYPHLRSHEVVYVYSGELHRVSRSGYKHNADKPDPYDLVLLPETKRFWAAYRRKPIDQNKKTIFSEDQKDLYASLRKELEIEATYTDDVYKQERIIKENFIIQHVDIEIEEQVIKKTLWVGISKDKLPGNQLFYSSYACENRDKLIEMLGCTEHFHIMPITLEN